MLTQDMGDAVGAHVEFAVSQRLAFEYQGYRVRGRVHLTLELRMHASLAVVGRVGPVPII